MRKQFWRDIGTGISVFGTGVTIYVCLEDKYKASQLYTKVLEINIYLDNTLTKEWSINQIIKQSAELTRYIDKDTEYFILIASRAVDNNTRNSLLESFIKVINKAYTIQNSVIENMINWLDIFNTKFNNLWSNTHLLEGFNSISKDHDDYQLLLIYFLIVLVITLGCLINIFSALLVMDLFKNRKLHFKSLTLNIVLKYFTIINLVFIWIQIALILGIYLYLRHIYV